MNIIPLTIEGLVAILLLLTILYCVRLNGQLKRLRADETVMKQVVAELTAATDRAERSIVGLKTTVGEADRDLGERLRVAERFCADITKHTEAGADVLNRLARIVAARAAANAEAVVPKPSTAPDPRDIAAAAQAFTERARARMKDRAA